ncbi:hypothetical protein SprV_0200736400 [Sparganum proliferum]
MESCCTERMVYGREGWREVQVDVNFYFGEPVDGGVGDCGGTTEDASEVLGPALRNLQLLYLKRSSIGAEKLDSSFDRGVVNRFDCSEEVLSLVAVCVPLDLLEPVSHPGVLHLLKPPLHKAATSAEVHFVVLSRTVDVGFVLPILLCEQIAEGGAIVVTPVLVSATCAAEGKQGG